MKKFLNYCEDYFCNIVLVVMLVLTFINAIARYVFLASMPFVEELTRLGLMILSLVGATVGAKRGAHLGLSVLTDFFPASGQKACEILGHISGIVFGVVLVAFGASMVQTEFVNELKTAGMQWPEWLFGMWVVVGGAFMVIRYIQLIIKSMKNSDLKEEKE